MEHPTPTPMLTRNEVAALLQVAPGTVDRMTKRGEIRVHRAGRCPRYVWAEVLADTTPVSINERVRQALLPKLRRER